MIQFLALAGGYVYRVATNPAAQKLAREAIKKIGAREVKQPKSIAKKTARYR